MHQIELCIPEVQNQTEGLETEPLGGGAEGGALTQQAQDPGDFNKSSEDRIFR